MNVDDITTAGYKWGTDWMNEPKKEQTSMNAPEMNKEQRQAEAAFGLLAHRYANTSSRTPTETNAPQLILHKTAIVTVGAKTIHLNTGGWHTATTKKRMNEALTALGMVERVYQKKGDWFIWDWTRGETLGPFSEGYEVSI